MGAVGNAESARASPCQAWVMADSWVTVEEVLAAKAAFEAGIPGWEAPAAHALGVARDGGLVEWRAVNAPNVHQLPAVVLGTVLGHRSGSATYRLDLQQFDEAIRLLEPAGACDAFEHPNLWAWKRLRSEISDGTVPRESTIVAVFLGAGDDDGADPAQAQLRELLRSSG